LKISRLMANCARCKKATWHYVGVSKQGVRWQECTVCGKEGPR